MLATETNQCSISSSASNNQGETNSEMTFTNLLIFGNWIDMLYWDWIWGTVLSTGWYKRLHNWLPSRPMYCVNSLPAIMPTHQDFLLQTFCRVLTSNWHQQDFPYSPRTSCHSSGTTSRGDEERRRKYQSPCRPVARPGQVCCWLASFNYKYSPFTYLAN